MATRRRAAGKTATVSRSTSGTIEDKVSAIVVGDITVPIGEVAAPTEGAANGNGSTKLAAPPEETNEQFLGRMMRVASFDGALVWVDCPLPGYEGVRVAYNVDNAFAVAELFATTPTSATFLDRMRVWSLFIRKMEWPFGIPTPTPDNPASYGVLMDQFRSLLMWVIGEGYAQAKKDRWGN